MSLEDGKRAYEAFTKAGPAPSGKSYASWDKLSDSAKAAWSYAAQAAHDNAIGDAERKAAKAAEQSKTEPAK